MSLSVRAQVLNLVTSYARVSGCTLFALDFIQTFPKEVRAIWFKPLSFSSLLFLLNRYGLFGSLATSLVIATPSSNPHVHISCSALNVAEGVFQTFSITATNILFTLRVYAIYAQSRSVLAIAGLLMFPRLFLDIWQYSMTEYVPPVDGQKILRACNFGYRSPAFQSRSQLAISVSQMAFDTYMIVLTVRKTADHAMGMRRLSQKSISQLLLRDGLLYFVAAFVLAGVQAGMVVASFINPEIGSASFVVTITPYFVVLPMILVNRLVLNLRNFDAECDGAESRSGTTVLDSILAFTSNRWVGNMGAPLDYTDWDLGLDVVPEEEGLGNEDTLHEVDQAVVGSA